jgi:hypothetical protein
MLIYYRSLTLAVLLLMAALGCGDDSEEDGCRGVDDDGDGFVQKCADYVPTDWDASVPRSPNAGRGKQDAGDDTDAGDDDAG